MSMHIVTNKTTTVQTINGLAGCNILNIGFFAFIS